MQGVKNKQNRVIFITGCSSGFGKEIALESLHRRYRVIATARNISDLDYLQDNPNALCLAVDITNSETITLAANTAYKKFGQIDILVNNAGVQYSCNIDDFDNDKVHLQFETNLFGTIYTSKLLLPFLKESPCAVIVNISSMSGICGSDGALFYGMTKAAIDNFTWTLRQYLKRTGNNIRVMSVNPGVFQTDFRKKSLGEYFPYDKEYPMPDIVAKEILNTLERDGNLPFRLILGQDSLERYKQVMAQMKIDYKFAKRLATNKK